MGDFNAVILVDDRINGAPVTTYETQDFVQLLDNSDLCEY